MAEVTIKGVRSLARKLRNMPGPVRDATREAIEQGATQIVKTMLRHVPVRTGDLSKSIGWTWGAVPKSALAITTNKNPKEGTLTIFAGNPIAYYARWVEFGTRAGVKGERTIDPSGRRRKVARTHPGTRAQPFFFPSYRAHKKEVKRKINASIRKAIKQVAASGGIG